MQSRASRRRVEAGKIIPDRVKIERHKFHAFLGISSSEKDTHVRRKFCHKVFKIDVILNMGLPRRRVEHKNASFVVMEC